MSQLSRHTGETKTKTDKQRSEIKRNGKSLNDSVLFVQWDKLTDSCFMLFKNSNASWPIHIWFPGNSRWLEMGFMERFRK